MPVYGGADEREVLESPKVQGTNEARAYSFDFTNEGVETIEGVPTVTLYDWSAGMVDVSDDKLSEPEAPAVGTVATMSGVVHLLLAHTEYRLYCRVDHDGGQTSELFCRIFGRA